MSNDVIPYKLKDAPALIERVLPVQKLSIEVYKEQMAVHGKTLTALGGYWKGRKPLILNRAVVLGCLLPATKDAVRDLEIFEMLLGMDEASFAVRWKAKIPVREILKKITITRIADYFTVAPGGVLPASSPLDLGDDEYSKVKVEWREDVGVLDRRRLEAQTLPSVPYQNWVEEAHRSEEVSDIVHDHIWGEVNEHLGTNASSFPELIEQLGVMRFGHRPIIGDTFCGSGQIPFEAARLGCDVNASDLNPIACMLTWGDFNIVGGAKKQRESLTHEQETLVNQVLSEVDRLGVETDGRGWRAKVFLYCVEVRCPQTGWLVPLLPTRVVSKGYSVVADLVPNPDKKRYDIRIRSGVSSAELESATHGTVGRDGKFGEAHLLHEIDGIQYKTKISTLRGDFQRPDGTVSNILRVWEMNDFRPLPGDLIQERLYCVQWMRTKLEGKGQEYDFRSVSDDDIKRESIVNDYVASNLSSWQSKGYVPDMQIEVGGPPRYQGQDLIRARGWKYWHHAFNPRQIMTAALVNQFATAQLKFGLTQLLNCNSRISRWNHSGGGGGIVAGAFDNQAISTLFNYGCRGTRYALDLADVNYKWFPISPKVKTSLECIPANLVSTDCDIFITDPPYGDAVKYEEILDFFIAWLRKNPAFEFSKWTWDSRRALAIKGEDEGFRRGMVAAYTNMTAHMPANGLQVIMFTHQSGSIWADMANIVWASGLQVTAAWYVVTEVEKRIQSEASNVKGTVLLVLRKRVASLKTSRDDLAWEIQDEVDKQIKEITGLNQSVKHKNRNENVFEDADIQMAGYAAALRILTRYAVIDGRDMASEAIRPRTRGETTFVDTLIEFAVSTANQALVPSGIAKSFWDKLSPAERFILKMVDIEAKGGKTLDNYQNFAKAFKVHDFQAFMASRKANQARLKSAVEFGRLEMSEGSELFQSTLRAVIYAVMELTKEVDSNEVIQHLSFNVKDYLASAQQRELVVALADYLASKTESTRSDEASAARILKELVKNQKLG
jgi:putative DNA methylase